MSVNLEEKVKTLTKIYKIKWILPVGLWAVFTLVWIAKPFVSSSEYWEATFLTISYYLGSWSSERLISELAGIYYEMLKEDEELPEEVKKRLSNLSILSFLTSKRRGNHGEK